MKLLVIAAVITTALVAPRIGYAATDLKSYQIHLSGALKDIQDGRPGRLYWAKQDLGFIIRHENWDPVHRSVAYYYLGVIEAMENNLNGAIKNYMTALKLNSEFAEVYFNLGAIYYKQGLQKKAEEAFLKTIELQPGFGRAHYSLGFVYLEQKKFDLAKKHADLVTEYGVPYKTLKEKLLKVAK